MVLLRTAHQLQAAQIPSRRIVRSLRRLRATLPETMPLTGLRLRAVGDEVAVRESGSSRWRADSGQLLFDFDVPMPPAPDNSGARGIDKTAEATASAPALREPAEATRPRRTAASTAPATGLAWFERGCDLEARDGVGAERAYRSALALDPDLVDAWLNLGVLLGHAGRLDEAITLYRRALKRLPQEALLHFNLAVMLEDAGRFAEALATYDHCLALDAKVADAHFNAARLHEQLGHTRDAIRHYSAYRRLTKAPAR
jgi:tetratricopeptide (TPR) repeat protein